VSYSHFDLVAMALMESFLTIIMLAHTFVDVVVAITIRYMARNFKLAWLVWQDSFTGDSQEVSKAI
jgi:hypothetical protein